MTTGFDGARQIKDGTVALADLSATGTPSSSTYLRGDNTWSTVTTSAPLINQDSKIVSSNFTINANNSAILSDYCQISSGITLQINSGGSLTLIN